MGDEKTEPLEELQRLGERLAEQDRALLETRNEYENACAVFDLKIAQIQEQKAAATKELLAALELRNAEVMATRAAVLQAWDLQKDLPKSIMGETWTMQLRINKVLEVSDEEAVLARLVEIGKYDDIVRHSFDKRKLRKLVEADLFDRSAVVLRDKPSLIFKGGSQ